MVTFYRPADRRGEFPAVVWNPRANAALADFSQGNLFKTEDPYVIQKLTELGYPKAESGVGQSPPESAVVTKKAKAPVESKKPPVAAKVSLKKRSAPQAVDSMDTDEVSPGKP